MASTLMTAASSAHTIEADLAALWRRAAAAGPVSRAVMSNLVIIGDQGLRPDPAALLEDPLVAGVVRRHPARIIAVDYHARREACAPAASSVGVMTFGAERSRYGVEIVAVRLACAEASLPSVVRAIARGDMPTTIWWNGDLSAAPAPAAMLQLGQQIVYDSREWRDVRGGFKLLARLLNTGSCPDLADVNWPRLAGARHALARGAPDTLVHAGGEAGTWLLDGWVVSQGMKPPGSVVRALTPAEIEPEPVDTLAARIAGELHSLRRDAALRSSVLAAADLAH
jgi:glucose-6-phosphate dehydrogenase assembly protein OpcA